MVISLPDVNVQSPVISPGVLLLPVVIFLTVRNAWPVKLKSLPDVNVHDPVISPGVLLVPVVILRVVNMLLGASNKSPLSVKSLPALNVQSPIISPGMVLAPVVNSVVNILSVTNVSIVTLPP